MATKVEWIQWKDQGSEHFRNHKWAEAITCYTSAIKVKPDEAVLYSNRAICETKLQKFQSARDDAEAALRLDPRNVKFYRILSESLMGLNLYKEALVACDKGLHLDPREPSLLSRQRECRSKLIGKSQPKKSECGKRPPMTRAQLFRQKRPEPTADEIEELSPLDMLQHGFFLAGGDTRLRVPIRQPDMALKMFQMAVDKGSIAAMYYIGMMHFKGQAGLKKDPIKAIQMWRKVAAQKPFCRINGEIKPNMCVAQAEHAIGDAFRHGIGVQKDEAEAANWYHKAGTHGSAEGMVSTASVHVNRKSCEDSPLFARILFRRAARTLYGEGEVNPMEDDTEDVHAIHFNVFAKLSIFRSPVKTRKDLHNKQVRTAMLEKRLEGWPTAKSYFQAFDAMNEARDLLVQKKFHESFQKLRTIWRDWDFALEDYRPFLKAARQILKTNPDDHSALYVVAVCAPEDDFRDKLKLILRCLQLDPSVADYHLMAAHLYAANEDFDHALKFCDKALELDAHPSWLYVRAHLLQLMGPQKVPVKKMIEAFQLFLQSVPSDHADVEESYYSIAWLLRYDNENDKGRVAFRMGRAAEEHRLICFPTMENYSAETYLTRNLMSEHCDNVMAGRTDPNISEVLCAACTNSASLSPCSACRKAYYCSQKCRRNHSIIHKISCGK